MKKLLIGLFAFSLLGATLFCSGEDHIVPAFREENARPAWWFLLRQSDLCVKASSVELVEGEKEYLSDKDGKVLAEYTPVKMKIERILFASEKIKYDGRFITNSQNGMEVNPGSKDNIKIFLVNLKGASFGAIVDSNSLGNEPKIPPSGIYILTRSNHKKSGEFSVVNFADSAMEGEYAKTLESLGSPSAR